MKLKQAALLSCLAACACLPFAASAQDAAASDVDNVMDTTPRLDPSAPNPAPAHPELAGVLQDFGGKDGLDALMETFMSNLMADPRTQPFFEGKDLARIKRELAEQFCVILGGDCVYSGRDMRTAHAGLKIDRNNFNALVEDLQRAMETHKVPFRSQNKLLAVLAPMHREAVTK